MSEENENKAVEQPLEEKAVEPQLEKKTLEQELEEEMKKWQGKVDEIKVRMHLGAMDAKDKAQPYIDKLEQDMAKAEEDLKSFGDASESAWQELSKGLRLSFKAIQQSADKAQKHFESKDD